MSLTIRQSTDGITDTVKAVVAQLVSVQRIGGMNFVSLPMFYPNGAAISVQIDRRGTRFSVSDGGFAYREVMLVGGESRFARVGRTISEEYGVQCAPPSCLRNVRLNLLRRRSLTLVWRRSGWRPR